MRAHGEVMDTRTVAEVLLPAGATTVTLRLEEFTDEIDESRVNVTLTLAGGAGYSVGDPSEATVSIDYPSNDDTQATPTPTPTPAVSPPDAPSDVSTSAPTRTSFTVSWTAETGKSYRVEREAAFLFSYGVWQVVADNVTGGSFTESDLPCDLFYVYQVRAMVAGSAYGASKLVLGQAQSCTAGTSDGARAARSPSTPVRKLRLVTDRPTETSIRIRLLFHRNMDEGDLTHTPVYGMKEYRVDRTRPGPPITQTPVPADWVDPVANPEYRMEHTVSEFDWTGLACGTHYWFRALGHGDGVEFEDGWGNVWSNAVHGSSRGCNRLAAPVVDVIPLPHRQALLKWDEIRLADEYTVEARMLQAGNRGWATPHAWNVADPDRTSLTVNLRTIVNYRGLQHSPYAYEFRVKAVDTGTDPIPSSEYSNRVILIDTPILSVNGLSPGSRNNDAQALLTWKEIVQEDVLGSEWRDFAGGAYSFRYRRLSDANNPHTDLNWTPDNPSEPITTVSNPISELRREEIYAIQLIYTVTKAGETTPTTFYSARDAFVWPSAEGADGGERVATFPLKNVGSVYMYRICEDGFPAADIGDWKATIQHAFGLWKAFTDLVTMTYLGSTCADYSDAIQDIDSNYNDKTGVPLTPSQLGMLGQYLKQLDVLTNAQTDDEEYNEVIMVDDTTGVYAEFKEIGIFPEFASELGFAGCAFDADTLACAVSRHVDTQTGYITDILLRRVKNKYAPSVMPGGDNIVERSDVKLNICPTGPGFKTYATLIHESGHVFGIRGGAEDPDWIPEMKGHPTISNTVMNYEDRNLKARGPTYKLPIEPDCSPHPLDIMAIYAIYQTD